MRCSIAEIQKPQRKFILLYWRRYLVLQHTFGKTQAWKSAHGYVQESWSGTSLYSSYHRATSVTVLKAAGLENCRVKNVTGHASDKSIESYCTRPTIEQQFESSAIVSRFLTQQNSVQPVQTVVPPQATSSFSATSSSAIHKQQTSQVHQSTFNLNPSTAPNFSHSVFHGCNFFFSPQKDNWNDLNFSPRLYKRFLTVFSSSAVVKLFLQEPSFRVFDRGHVFDMTVCQVFIQSQLN